MRPLCNTCFHWIPLTANSTLIVLLWMNRYIEPPFWIHKIRHVYLLQYDGTKIPLTAKIVLWATHSGAGNSNSLHIIWNNCIGPIHSNLKCSKSQKCSIFTLCSGSVNMKQCFPVTLMYSIHQQYFAAFNCLTFSRLKRKGFF